MDYVFFDGLCLLHAAVPVLRETKRWRTPTVGPCWRTATALWSITCTTTRRAGKNAIWSAFDVNHMQTKCKLGANKWVSLHWYIQFTQTLCKRFLAVGQSSYEVGHPGSGSKWCYINSWVMCWPTEHAKKPLTGWGADAGAKRAVLFQTWCKLRLNRV